MQSLARFLPASLPSNARWRIQLLSLGVLAFAIAWGVTSLCPYVPVEHDEYSLLLSADTLRHGRLSNPTPMAWEPLQSFHVIMQPSYASKYPLGPALFVLLGWSIFGTPVAGSWMGAAMGCTSIAWMLAGAVRRSWAIVGGLLVACHPMFQTTWSQTLHGGWLAATGCSLLFGALLRLRRRESIHAACIGGIGIALLALTRPFEGFVCVTFSLMLFSWDRFRIGSGWYLRSIGFASIPIGLALFLIVLQNVSTTGNWRQMPYQVHEESYGVAPLFVLGTPNEPRLESIQPQLFREYHRGWSFDCFQERAGLVGFLRGLASEANLLLRYWGSTLSIIPILGAFLWRKYRWARFAGQLVAIQLLAAVSVTWIFARYLAPITPWLVLLAILSCIAMERAMRAPQKNVRIGIAVVLLFIQGLQFPAAVSSLEQRPGRSWAQLRQRIEHQLGEVPGKHLILVEYHPNHNVHQEWVYNLANPEGERVMWARADRASWQALLFLFYGQDRTLWRLNADDAVSSNTSQLTRISSCPDRTIARSAYP